MQALIVVDAQNEFAPGGERTVPNHARALEQIRKQVARARREHQPIAWIQHHNLPHEWPGFVPGSWGAELSPGLGPDRVAGPERLFRKQAYGAFSGTGLEDWLRGLGVEEVMLVGFYAHMCLSTSAREALVRGFAVTVDPEATGSRDLAHDRLGTQTADEVRRSALLHLAHMGVTLAPEGTPEPSAGMVQ